MAAQARVRPLRVRVKVEVPTALDSTSTFEATVESVSLADVITRVRAMMEEIEKPVTATPVEAKEPVDKGGE